MHWGSNKKRFRWLAQEMSHNAICDLVIATMIPSKIDNQT
jgi:hypothetical protein